MGKYVIETVQVIRRKYYAKVEDPSWAHDAIVFGELEEFSNTSFSEDIISTTKVDKWPKAKPEDNMNSAVMTYDSQTGKWTDKARWDLSE